MGVDTIAKTFRKRSKYYENLFDSETGLMRGKDSKGNFRNPFKPLEATSPMNTSWEITLKQTLRQYDSAHQVIMT